VKRNIPCPCRESNPSRLVTTLTKVSRLPSQVHEPVPCHFCNKATGFEFHVLKFPWNVIIKQSFIVLFVGRGWLSALKVPGSNCYFGYHTSRYLHFHYQLMLNVSQFRLSVTGFWQLRGPASAPWQSMLELCWTEGSNTGIYIVPLLVKYIQTDRVRYQPEFWKIGGCEGRWNLIWGTAGNLSVGFVSREAT